jgi:hypothetical protein
MRKTYPDHPGLFNQRTEKYKSCLEKDFWRMFNFKLVYNGHELKTALIDRLYSVA